MVGELEKGRSLPFELNGAVLFFGGFTPPPPGRTVGSIGPTTSRRMEPSVPPLLKAGVKGMIGKGKWSPEAASVFREAGAVYFGATGGAAALLSRSVRSVSSLAFADPGGEAPSLLEVVELPLTVAIDAKGNDLFEQGRKKYIKGTDQTQKNVW
jgi:fumarate hydratase subunit beta